MDRNDTQIVFVVPDAACEYLSVGLLSACLKQRGFDRISVFPSRPHDLRRQMQKSKYTVLAFTTPTPYADEFIQTAKGLKNQYSNIITVFGGPHATFFPRMIEQEGVDGVCVGEGRGICRFNIQL